MCSTCFAQPARQSLVFIITSSTKVYSGLRAPVSQWLTDARVMDTPGMSAVNARANASIVKDCSLRMLFVISGMVSGKLTSFCCRLQHNSILQQSREFVNYVIITTFNLYNQGVAKIGMKSDKVKKFQEWFMQKYFMWRGNRVASMTDFAAYLGIQQQSVSAWWNGRSLPGSSEHITKIAAAFPDIYDVLEIPDPRTVLPPQVPQGLVDLFNAAHAEVLRRLQERHLDGNEPEAKTIMRETYIEFGFNWSETDHPGKSG